MGFIDIGVIMKWQQYMYKYMPKNKHYLLNEGVRDHSNTYGDLSISIS